MAVAWVVVALLEWTAWLDEPHYGRGLPPRYYVPHVALPPPVGIRQGEPAYPILPAVDDEPTFVASTQEWGLAEWPEAEATASALVAEDTIAAPPPAAVVDEDQGVPIVPLPPPIPEIEETIEAEILIHEEYEEIEDEPAPVVEVIEAVVVQPPCPSSCRSPSLSSPRARRRCRVHPRRRSRCRPGSGHGASTASTRSDRRAAAASAFGGAVTMCLRSR